MKDLEKHLEQLNSLLHTNYEVEKIYVDVLERIEDEDLKAFFRNIGFERNEYSRVLRGEIIRLGGAPTSFDNYSNTYRRVLTNLRKLISFNNEIGLLDHVCKIKKQSIRAYNNLLQQMNLPLSVCKILVEQRDKIQRSLNNIKAQEALVA